MKKVEQSTSYKEQFKSLIPAEIGSQIYKLENIVGLLSLGSLVDDIEMQEIENTILLLKKIKRFFVKL